MRKLIDSFKDFVADFYIIVTIDAKLLEEHSSSTILNEGRWEPSGEGDYWQRIDTAHFDFQQKHIHIAHKKHINTKGEQVSWNQDGTRHDASSFNTNFTSMNRAKAIAKKSLGLDDTIILEHEDQSDGTTLLESVSHDIPVSLPVFIFTARTSMQSKRLLKD